MQFRKGREDVGRRRCHLSSQDSRLNCGCRGSSASFYFLFCTTTYTHNLNPSFPPSRTLEPVGLLHDNNSLHPHHHAPHINRRPLYSTR
jgi:hypothetical protein